MAWTEKVHTALILDESFLDFAEEDKVSFLTEEMLKRYPGLYIVKSISKSYGVPGLRLGILASYDRECLDRIKIGTDLERQFHGRVFYADFGQI